MRVDGAALRASRRTSAYAAGGDTTVAIPIGESADSTFVLPDPGSASMIRPRCPAELAAAGQQFTTARTDGPRHPGGRRAPAA
jgi:hypothetical protein